MVPEPLKKPQSGHRPQIPGYRVEGVIGRGATGTVYRARQLAVDREVALKVLHPELASKPRTVQRLQREARTTARLAHPHIVTAIDMGETQGQWWYAMELVEGPSLALVLRQEGRLREREALRYFIPLCEAIEHLWEHGVVHRDIKPGNILIDRACGARLADLGLAFADDEPSMTQGGGTLGTPHYISPEQAVDPHQADVRSDLWSFGATLYHALCGRPPFHGSSTAEVLAAVLNDRIADPLRLEPGLSRGLVLVLRKCLTREPADRYQTPHELLLDLERVRERRQPKVVARNLDPLERRPRPWLPWVLAAVGVVLGLGLIGLLLGGVGGGEELEQQTVLPALETFAPLDALVSRVSGVAPGAGGAGELLRELEDLRSAVPATLVPRWEAAYAQLRERLRVHLVGAWDGIAERAEARMDSGDYVGAWAVLEKDMPQEFAESTGFTVNELEQRFGFLRARSFVLRSKVEAKEDQLSAVVSKKLRERKDVLAADAERLRERGRFKSAMALLDVSEDSLLKDLGYEGYAFSSSRREELFADVRVELGVKRQEVEFAWRRIDGQLRDWVEHRAVRLRETLDLPPDLTTSVTQELFLGFENELFERGIERGEMADEITSYATTALGRTMRELDAFVDEQREQQLRSAFELNRELDASRWKRRDYESVWSLWNDLALRIEEAPGDSTRAWRGELERRVELRMEEARLLRGLLARTTEGIIAANGARRELRVLASGILEEGRVEAGLDPLRDGFDLVPDRGEPFHLELESLARGDLLGFAGMPLLEEDLASTDRLILAAFLFHEGQLSRAEATLRSGQLPSAGDPGLLAVELGGRILGALETESAAREERDEEVDYFLALATEEAVLQSPERALMAIDKLLGEYVEVPKVRMLRPTLLEKQRRLENRGRSFQDSFAPASLEQVVSGETTLSFGFEDGQHGSWEAGFWRPDGAGWVAPRVIADWEELERRWGARLILRPPLDVGRRVTLAVSFEFTDEVAPPQLLMASLLGYHIALVGPGLPTGDRRSRWLVGQGDLDEFLEDVRRGKGQESPGLLVPGRRQELRIVLHAGRGELRFELDGVAFAGRDFPGRTPEPKSLVLRSWDPIRLRSVTLTGTGF